MNKPTSVPPNGGGGVRQRLLRGTLLKWSEVDGYFDRDGVRPVEGPYLLWAMENGYQRWKAQILVDEIIDKPLPDLDHINGAIPKSEWEPGLDGHPRIPYSHQYCVYLLDPNDGQFFTLMNSTVGMRMLWESLAERWEVMRHLRGADVIAVVNLATRPFRTAKWGIKYRPDLKILEWRKPGGGAETDWLDRLLQDRNCHRPHRHHRHRRRRHRHRHQHQPRCLVHRLRRTLRLRRHVRLIRPLHLHRLLHVPLRRASRKRRTAWHSSTKSNHRRFARSSTTTCLLSEGPERECPHCGTLSPLTPGVRLHLRTPQFPPASRECVPCLRSISTPRPAAHSRCMKAGRGRTPPAPILASGASASLSMTARCNHGRRAIRCRKCSRRSPSIQPAGRSWPTASSSTAPFTSTF